MALEYWQVQHNERLNADRALAKLEDEQRDESNRIKIEANNKFLKENPDYPYKACPNLDFTPPRRVHGIRYVE